MENETIAAISTATGTGGIGIIRMSGKNCFKILEKIFKPHTEVNEIKRIHNEIWPYSKQKWGSN